MMARVKSIRLGSRWDATGRTGERKMARRWRTLSLILIDLLPPSSPHPFPRFLALSPFGLPARLQAAPFTSINALVSTFATAWKIRPTRNTLFSRATDLCPWHESILRTTGPPSSLRLTPYHFTCCRWHATIFLASVFNLTRWSSQRIYQTSNTWRSCDPWTKIMPICTHARIYYFFEAFESISLETISFALIGNFR